MEQRHGVAAAEAVGARPSVVGQRPSTSRAVTRVDERARGIAAPKSDASSRRRATRSRWAGSAPAARARIARRPGRERRQASWPDAPAVAEHCLRLVHLFRRWPFLPASQERMAGVKARKNTTVQAAAAPPMQRKPPAGSSGLAADSKRTRQEQHFDTGALRCAHPLPEVGDDASMPQHCAD